MGAWLAVGEAYCSSATTHMDIFLRAKQRGVDVKVVHNASIMNAVGACGLQLYNFGQTISMVFFTDTWRPDSFYDKIAANKKIGLHTLCLLGVYSSPFNLLYRYKGKRTNCGEPVKVQCSCVYHSLQPRGNKIYEPPRFMTVNQCIQQLLEVEELRNEQGINTMRCSLTYLQCTLRTHHVLGWQE